MKNNMKNNNQKSSRGVSLTQAQWDRCERISNQKGYGSRNAFIRDAVDFYCSWNEKEQSERFLTPALESVISAKIRDSEERINRNLFKLAVNLSILSKIMIDENGTGYDDELLDDYRRESVKDVSQTNGTIKIEDKFR